LKAAKSRKWKDLIEMEWQEDGLGMVTVGYRAKHYGAEDPFLLPEG